MFFYRPLDILDTIFVNVLLNVTIQFKIYINISITFLEF